MPELLQKKNGAFLFTTAASALYPVSFTANIGVVIGGFLNWRTAAVSTYADATLKTPLAAIQIEYNLLQRSAEQDYWPMANEMGLAVMGYSPMAGGVLTSKYRKGEAGRKTLTPGSETDAENKKRVLF